MPSIPVGDHIRHVGSVYAHHSLVDRVLNESAVLVVHFNDDRPNARKVSGKFPYFDKAIVLEQTLLLNSSVDIVQLVVYDDEHQVEPNEDRLRVARSRLGNVDYGLLTNNCEAFMHEICVGIRYSRQAEFTVDLIHTIIFMQYLILIHLCHRWLRGIEGGRKNSNTNTVIAEMDEGPLVENLKLVTAGSNEFSKDTSSAISHRNHLYSFFICNICFAVLLFVLFIWYRVCILLLTKFSTFCYHVWFPDFYS